MKKNFFRVFNSFLVITLLSFIMFSGDALARKEFKKVWERQMNNEHLYFSDDGTKVVVKSGSELRILDALTGKSLFHTKTKGNVAISHNGKYLAVPFQLDILSGKIHQSVCLYDLSSFELIKEIPLSYSYSYYKNKSVYFSADDKNLYMSVFILDASDDVPYIGYGWSKLILLNIESQKEKELNIDKFSELYKLFVSKDGKYYILISRELGISKYDPPHLVTTAYDATTNKKLYDFTLSWREEYDGISEEHTSSTFHLSDDNKLYIRYKKEIWDDDLLVGHTNHIKVLDLDADGKTVSDCEREKWGGIVCFMDNDNCLFNLEYNKEKGNNYYLWNFPSCSFLESFWEKMYLKDYHNGYYLATFEIPVDTYSWTFGVGVYTLEEVAEEEEEGDGGIVDTFTLSSLSVNNNILKINLSFPKPMNCEIKLFDSTGKELDLISKGNFSGEQVFTYNIQGFPLGMYFVSVNGEMLKFMISR